MRLDRLIKGSVLLVAAFVAFAMSSVAFACNGLVGTYTTTVTTPAQLKGTWALTLGKGGTYTVVWNGQALARGTYTATAETITFDRERGSSCTGAGTYAWKTLALRKVGTTVSFVRKHESASCQARAAVLAHRFTQVH